MSAGLPYLQKQRKSELTDIAKSTGLNEYVLISLLSEGHFHIFKPMLTLALQL